MEPLEIRTLSSSVLLGKDSRNDRHDDVSFEESEFDVELADEEEVKVEDLSDTDEDTGVSVLRAEAEEIMSHEEVKESQSVGKAVEAEGKLQMSKVRESISVIKVEEENKSDMNEDTDGISVIKTEDECDSLCSDTKCIVFLAQLKQLARMNISACKTCKSSEVELVDDYVGSALYLKWVCKEGHVSARWCSQPLLNKGMHSGDFLICSTILTSGNNYSKMKSWASMLHLKFPSAFQFHEFREHIWSPA